MSIASPVEIRRCRDGDWRDVRRLHVQMALTFPIVVDVDLNKVLATTDDHWKDFARTCAGAPDQAVFVAETPHRCAAMGHVGVDGPVARLSMLYVDEPLRRQGIATALVAAQVGWALEAGATELTCHIPDENPAERIAERLGLGRTEELYVTRNRLTERKWTGRCPAPD